MANQCALGCWAAGPGAGPCPQHRCEFGDSCHGCPRPADLQPPCRIFYCKTEGYQCEQMRTFSKDKREDQGLWQFLPWERSGAGVYSWTQLCEDLWWLPTAIVAAREERKMIMLWTLYQALKLLERHAIVNQRCDNWVGIIITSGLIMGFQKQSGGGVGWTLAHLVVLTFKCPTCPWPQR